MNRARFPTLLAIALALGLSACAPSLVASPVRAGETVTITLTATADAYAVTLSVLNAETSDDRCITLATTDLGCVIGDLDAGTVTTVTVTGVPGAVDCRAFHYTRADLNLTSYRTTACRTGD